MGTARAHLRDCIVGTLLCFYFCNYSLLHGSCNSSFGTGRISEILVYSFIIFFALSLPVLSIAPAILNARVSGNAPTWGVIGIDYVSDLLITFFSNSPESLVVLVGLFTLGMVNILLMKRRVIFYTRNDTVP